MRALLVSDLHYSLKQLDWVLANADEFDLVVAAGDHLDIRSYVEPDAQIAVVLEYLARIASKTRVAACSGNHDLNGDNEFGERSAVWLERARNAGVFVDGTNLVVDDALITVCPWWDGPRTRAQLDEALAANQREVGGRMWIWVHHAPPEPSPTSWTGRRHYGDTQLNAFIERYEPTLVLCGHVHESPFADGGGWIDRIGSTFAMNAGRQGGPVPAHAIVDTNARTLHWVSATGVEERSFDPVQYSG